MAARPKAQEGTKIALESSIAGVLVLLIDERDERTRDRTDTRRTEVLLARAGLSIDEIASLTGKTYDAVRKAISRGKASNG